MIKLGKKLLITEKPSVAMEFAKALKITTNRKNGYLESDNWIITWCVGHLVTMSYPEKYDEKLKFWRLDTLPFMPEEWKYEVIPQVKNQFDIVKSLLQREDVEEIYNAGDSGREGEYIEDREIDYGQRKSAADSSVGHFAYIFDFNFTYGLKYIEKNQYLDKFYNRFKDFEDEKTKERYEKIYKLAKEYIREKIDEG